MLLNILHARRIMYHCHHLLLPASLCKQIILLLKGSACLLTKLPPLPQALRWFIDQEIRRQ